MFSCRNHILALVLLAANEDNRASAFSRPSWAATVHYHRPTSLAAEGFGRSAVKERPAERAAPANEQTISALSAEEAKQALIELIPRMTGNEEEYRAVESYVNLLEEKYMPVQTIDFLNLAMTGEWQLVSCDTSDTFVVISALCALHTQTNTFVLCSVDKLFSTNLMVRPNRKLRLRELVQKIESNGFNGSVTNMAQWDFAEDEETFDATGNFNVKCSYTINQGARMVVDLDDHELRPAKGSKIPSDVPALVGEYF